MTYATKNLRVILTIASLDPKHGGPSRSVVALATELGRLGVRVHLITCQNAPGRSRPWLPESELVTPDFLPLACRKTEWHAQRNGFFQRIKYLADDTMPTIIHDTGLWLPTNHACAEAARRLRLPLVLSPRGMLSSWSLRHHGLKKRVAWWLYQRRDLSTVNLLHATSQPEAAEFEAVSATQPIAVIPNGVEITGPSKSRGAVPRDGAGERNILFLSRLHPKKGLLDLVEAWAEVRPSGWRVIVGGADEANFERQVKTVVREKGLAHQFDFIGQVAEGKKWDLYFRSDLFVLPSRSENFGLVIGEALACGVPVIATDCTPWAELLTHRCGWWIEGGPKPLAEALLHATALTDAQRHEMGARGRSLIESKYTWANVAKTMKSVYRWLLGMALKPGCVY